MKRFEISGNEILELIETGSERLSRGDVVVKGDVSLDGSKLTKAQKTPIIFKSLRFESEIISLTNFILPQTSISFEKCDFVKKTTYLDFDLCAFNHFYIERCNLSCVSFLNTSLKRAYLLNTSIKQILDLSTLTVNGYLRLINTTVGKLVLHNISDVGIDRIRVPMVETDNPVAACQFNLALIPVFVSSQTASELLEKKH